MRFANTILVTFALLALGVAAPAAQSERYTAGATFVARTGSTLFDNGFVACHGNAGEGGACVPWGAGDSILVVDDSLGEDVAFQACVDNDGDRICSQGASLVLPGCEDDIYFSHSDGGVFHNPVGPMRTSFRAGCPGGFPGYVVFLCSGVHQDLSGPHVHQVTTGMMEIASGGEGSGNFCAFPQDRMDSKTYAVILEAGDCTPDPGTHTYGPGTGVPRVARDTNVWSDCDGDGIPGGYDGHRDYALGGAMLTAALSPGCNDGDVVDHSPFPYVQVSDDILGMLSLSTPFTVATDTVNNLPPLDPGAPNCGDGEVDFSAHCLDACWVGFPPGLDGTYHVIVQASSGVVTAS